MIPQRPLTVWLTVLWLAASPEGAVRASAQDLPAIKQAGVLRHVGIPYANFVTGVGDGLDVELMQGFAKSIGVTYQYVRGDWDTILADLTGQRVQVKAGVVEVVGETPVKADIAASGITVIPWRTKVVDFSEPTFPTQVWLIARADSALKPIVPTGRLEDDIVAVKRLIAGRTMLCKAGTCLDPNLYDIAATKALYRLFPGSLNELAPAVIAKEAETTLLDVPDTLVALSKWPGTVKIIGPVSVAQDMGVAFRKDSPELRRAFNDYLAGLRRDGTYRRLVEKYYGLVFDFFPEFFKVAGRGTESASSSAQAAANPVVDGPAR